MYLKIIFCMPAVLMIWLGAGMITEDFSAMSEAEIIRHFHFTSFVLGMCPVAHLTDIMRKAGMKNKLGWYLIYGVFPWSLFLALQFFGSTVEDALIWAGRIIFAYGVAGLAIANLIANLPRDDVKEN